LMIPNRTRGRKKNAFSQQKALEMPFITPINEATQRGNAVC